MTSDSEGKGPDAGTTQVVRWRPSRYRFAQLFCAAVVLSYALAVLGASWLSAALGFHTVHGERQVVAVQNRSAMQAAGLQVGDIIVGINGKIPESTVARAHALWGMEPGQRLSLDVERNNQTHRVSAILEHQVPFASAAAFVIGALLLGLGLFADRGRVIGHPQVFFRATLVYVVFVVGCFSFEAINHNIILYVPWIFSVNLAGPVTCHQMLQFPLGPTRLGKRLCALLYLPPCFLSGLVIYNHLAFVYGKPLALHATLQLVAAICIGSLAALYTAVGALQRWKRLHDNPDFDRTAAAWLRVGAASIAAPLVVGVAIALLKPTQFATTLYKPVVAVTICGGVFSVVMAMSRVPFGSLDVLWRRSSGYLLATGLGVVLYFGTVTVFGGAVSFFSGGDFRSALAATLFAAILFGPIRVRLQRFVDQRFDKDRARARRLLREAAEEAATTLDVTVLEDQLVRRVKKAVAARAALLYVESPRSGWRRSAETGDHDYPAQLTPGALLQHITSALRQRVARVLLDGSIVIPIGISEGEPAALLVVPDPDQPLDEEAKDLLYTAGINFAVALGNARAHGRVSSLHVRLKREVDLAEQRRLEINRLKERLEDESKPVLMPIGGKGGRMPIIGQGLKGTFELVHKVAQVDSSVLVRGETGVGKELVARAIHAASSRRDKPFVVVDCGAISAGLFESTLFGHVKGAFTGAIKDTQGAFRAANGGTIFLDELGELPEELQPKLLRVLQEREIQAVGETGSSETIDVRVIAGTNRDLSEEVAAGNFREDLLYRVRVVEVVVPPLRERLSDIEALAEEFLESAAEKTGRSPKQLTPDALGALLEYDWPGNVRELEHTLEAAVVYCEGDEIRATDLPIFDRLFQQRGRSKISRTAVGSEGGTGGAPRANLRQALEGLERERLAQALAEHDNNKTRTADALGISRGALLRRLKRYGLMS